MPECVFCKIINGVLPTKFEYQSDLVVAFPDINPKAKTHILILPKQHIKTLSDLEDSNVAGELITAAKAIAKSHNLNETGYRLIVNNGKHADQEVDHLHLHLLGGNALGPMICKI